MLVNDAFDGVDENGIIDGSSVISVGITYKFKKRGFDRGIPAAVAFDALLAQQADYDAQISQYVAERDAALARLRPWLEGQLVENERAGLPDRKGVPERALRLRDPRTVTWAFLAWDK